MKKGKKIIALLMAFALIMQYGVSVDSLYAYANDKPAQTEAAANKSADAGDETINDDEGDPGDKTGTENNAIETQEKASDETPAEEEGTIETTPDGDATPSDENCTAEAGDDEKAEEPSDVKQTVSAGGAEITAEYKSDTFKCEVTFKADDAAGQHNSSDAIDKLVGKEKTAEVIYAFDLYFVNEAGERIEPTDAVKISIDFDKAQNEGVPGELRVVHIDDSGKAEYIDNATVSGDASSAEFTNDSFSEYDVIAESGSIIEVANEAELQAVVADLNANGGEKYVKLTQDIAFASNRKVELTKGNLTILGEDHKLTATFYVKNNAVLNLGMDGYSKTLTVSSSRSDYGIIGAMGSCTVNLYDGVTLGPCSRIGSAGGITAESLSVINMYGGTITGCQSHSVSGGVYITNNAVFNMHGGTIENCTGVVGGAVGMAGGSPLGGSSEGKCQFNMTGGNISNCVDQYRGGGAVNAYTNYPVKMTISGGTIKNCSSSGSFGGGICLVTFSGSGSTFEMNGGTITGNQCPNGYGGGILVYSVGNDSHIHFNKGVIESNQAIYGGGVFLFKGADILIADGFGLYNNSASSAGDDIYNNGISATLGSAATGVKLKSTGMKISGWYYDGTTDEDGGSGRWVCDAASSEENYIKTFSHSGKVYGGEYALKAAHGPIYKVTFDPDGGAPDPDDQKVTENEKAARPETDPKKNDYEFAGWFKKTGETTVEDKAFDFNTKITEDIELKAKWTPAEYKITYNLDGGSLAEGKTNPAKYTIESDDITLNNPAKTGYTFTGWTGTDLDGPAKAVTIEKGSTGNREYTANWTPISYVVKFDANSGKGSMADEAFDYDEEKALTKNSFTKSGYSWTGWNTKADGSGTGYADEATVKNLTAEDGASITLYAQWTANDSKLSYNANGGSGEMAEKTGKVDEVVKVASNGFTREGYTFDGWNTAADGSGTKYAENADFTLTPEPSILYAQWKVNQYTITFDSNDGSAVAPITQAYGTAVTAPTAPTREGYTFAGWDKDIPSTMPAEDMTITAKWDPINYVVKFEANSGKGSMADETFDYDEEKALTKNAFTKAGYTFTGWNTMTSPTDDNPGTAYADEVAVKNLTAEDGDTITLYAQWTANDSKLLYNANGGSGEMEEKTGKVDETVKVASNGFTREGHTFDRWNTAADGSGTKYAGNADFILASEPSVLYAQWKVNQYTITFDSNDGSAVDPITQDYGTAVTAPAAPTREGYTFAGWDTQIPSTMPAENITITAKWTPISYAVKFDENSGERSMADEAFKYDEEKALTKNAFTRSGYTWTGWNTKADGSGTGYADETKVKNLTAEDGTAIILYAQWTANDSKLSYNANGGSGEMDETIGKTDQTVKVASNGFTREGYTFDSWNTAADGSGTKYAENADFTLTSEPTVLYAQWKANEYTITFDSKGGSAVAPITQDYGTDITAPADPTREGYTFAGWDTQIPSTMPAEDITITAKWTKNPEPVAPVVDDDDDTPAARPPRRPGRARAAAPVTPAVPAAPDATPAAEPAEVVPDEPTPAAEPEPEPQVIPDEPTPLAEGTWALVNLISAIATLLGGALALFRRKEEEDEDEEQPDQYRTEDEGKDDNRGSRMLAAKILGAVAGIAAPVIFFLTEDMSLPMELVDKWTILMLVVLAVQIVAAVLNKRASELEDDNEDEY